MTETGKKNYWKPIALWLGLILITAAGFTLVIIPFLVIMPFKYQSPDGLELALNLRSISPIATLVIFATLIALTVTLWRRSRRWIAKTLLVLILLLNLVPVWFARQNHFEWMFNPLPNAEYAQVADTDFVQDTDKVLAVEIDGDTVSYPVRQMAYHHIVNDEVGGKPIVATY